MISAKAVKELRELRCWYDGLQKALQEAMVIQKQWKFLEKMVLLKLKRK